MLFVAHYFNNATSLFSRVLFVSFIYKKYKKGKKRENNFSDNINNMVHKTRATNGCLCSYTAIIKFTFQCELILKATETFRLIRLIRLVCRASLVSSRLISRLSRRFCYELHTIVLLHECYPMKLVKP